MTIQDLVNIDSTFSESSFIAKVDNTFIMLLSSIMMYDMDRVKHKISNELYSKYTTLTQQLKQNNERQMYDELNVKSTEILKIYETDTQYKIDVLLISRYMDYKIDSSTGNFKSGINTHRVEKNNYLTFSKNKNTKELGITKKCPGCGANIDSNNTGICSYCGTSYNLEDYDWILTDIK